MISPQLAATLARRLETAAQQRTEIDCLSLEYPELNEADAYAVQRALRELAQARGVRVAGTKAGLTAKAKQQAMGVFEPIYGFIGADTIVEDGEALSPWELIHPRAEPETAFILARDLCGPGVTPEMAIAATDAIAPALEVIDSRYRGFSFTFADVIADNASAARVVLGKPRADPNKLDLALLGMVFDQDGEVLDTAAGAAVLGSPANAVAWLANKLAEVEEWLPAGALVMPGGMCNAYPLVANSLVRARFDGLGEVSFRVAT